MEHNLELLRRLDEIVAIGRPVVIGTSRKSFLGKLAGGRDEAERLPGTIATNVLALERGASVFRVHDVAQVADALTVAAATVGSDGQMDEPDDDYDELDDDEDEDDEDGACPRRHDRDHRPLALHAPRRREAEREVGQRLVFDIVFELDGVRRDGHRPRRGHGRLRRGLRAGRAGAPRSAPTRRSSGSARPSPTA